MIYMGLSLIPVLLVIFAIVFIVNIVRRMERRADERLRIDKENLALQQQQLDEIKKRLSNIEGILKQVD